MFGLSILLAFGSVYLLYVYSKHMALLSSSAVQRVLIKRKMLSTVLSALCFAISAVMLMYRLGLVNGSLVGVLLWILLASIVTLFMLFKKVRVKHFVLSSLAISCLEFLQFAWTYAG